MWAYTTDEENVSVAGCSEGPHTPSCSLGPDQPARSAARDEAKTANHWPPQGVWGTEIAEY